MVEVVVCVGSSCHIGGAKDVVGKFEECVREYNLSGCVRLSGSFCMGRCSEPGVSVTVDGDLFFVKPDGAEEFFVREIIGRCRD